jgi:hypothetical protein
MRMSSVSKMASARAMSFSWTTIRQSATVGKGNSMIPPNSSPA